MRNSDLHTRFSCQARGLWLARISSMLLVAAAGLPTAAAQQTTDATSWLQFIGLELRQLRVEILEQHAAEESAKLLQTERDLASLRLDLNRSRNEEQAQKQELAELEKQASDPASDSQARAHVQTIVSELTSRTDRKSVV